MRRALGALAIAILSLGAGRAVMGGWAVITVEHLPESLVVGQPATIAFTVRQHGKTPLSDRSPTVALKKDGAGWLTRGERTRATLTDTPGRYETTLTPEDTGAVRITIDADFYGARVTLLPVPVVPAGTSPASATVTDRGRALFVAKGCFTCHVKRDDPDLRDYESLNFAPELTGRGFAPDWIAAKLADPAKNRIRFNDWLEMPNLGLDREEIAALARYVNARAGEIAAKR